MYIIIAGGGTVGFHIASLLAEEKQEVVLVEQSEEALENIRRQLDVKTISEMRQRLKFYGRQKSTAPI